MAFFGKYRKFSSGTKLRNIILLVKDTSASANFYRNAIGVTIKIQSDSMVQLDAGGTAIILKVPAKKRCFCLISCIESAGPVFG